MSSVKTRKHGLKAVPKAAALDGDQVNTEDGLCPRCMGIGIEIIPGKGARTCFCRLEEQEGQFARIRVPKRYDGFHFHNYQPRTQTQQAALKTAMNLVKDFPAVDRGLLLMGNVGVGKTHLAVAVLKGLAERGFKCLFYEFQTLLKEIQDSYNPNTHTSELGVLSPVLTTEVLVLDELGASKPTDWVRDTMSHIINSRYNDRKLTIFTTNFGDAKRDERDEVLEDRIGTRLRSRLFEMCKTVPMIGEDYRKTFDRAQAAKNQ